MPNMKLRLLPHYDFIVSIVMKVVQGHKNSTSAAGTIIVGHQQLLRRLEHDIFLYCTVPCMQISGASQAMQRVTVHLGQGFIASSFLRRENCSDIGIPPFLTLEYSLNECLHLHSIGSTRSFN